MIDSGDFLPFKTDNVGGQWLFLSILVSQRILGGPLGDVHKIAVSSESEIDMWATVVDFEERYSRTLACHKNASVIFCLRETSLELLL